MIIVFWSHLSTDCDLSNVYLLNKHQNTLCSFPHSYLDSLNLFLTKGFLWSQKWFLYITLCHLDENYCLFAFILLNINMIIYQYGMDPTYLEHSIQFLTFYLEKNMLWAIILLLPLKKGWDWLSWKMSLIIRNSNNCLG